MGCITLGEHSKNVCRTAATLAPIGKTIEQEIKKDDSRLHSLLQAVLSPAVGQFYQTEPWLIWAVHEFFLLSLGKIDIRGKNDVVNL